MKSHVYKGQSMNACGQFSERVMQDALADAAGQLDVAHHDAELLHMANNALFALPDADLVIRITRSNVMRDRVQKVARLGRWLNSVGAPAIRLIEGISKPLTCNGLLATVWSYIPPGAATPTVADLGAALKKWHHLRAPDGLLPHWNPAAVSRQRINDADGLDPDDRDYLLAWCDELEPQINDLNRRYPDSLVHGDAHVGNLLRRNDGEVVFCDFDSTAFGPPHVDLAAVAAGETWFDQNGTHAALAEAYGQDVTQDPDWPTFRSARELAFVVGGVPLLKSTPGVAEEFALRLQSIKDREESVTWTPYAAFGTSKA